jgi:hypothetical protein
LKEQFKCICDYLGWKLAFSEKFATYKAGEIANDDDAKNQMNGLWEFCLFIE